MLSKVLLQLLLAIPLLGYTIQEPIAGPAMSGIFANQPYAEQIHFNYHHNKCLDVRGAVFANGTPVQIYDCNGSAAQKWYIRRGSTRVHLAGTNYCLDAGSPPTNGVQLKIWTCHQHLPAQQWHYTGDYRIALEHQGYCVDLEHGDTTNGNKVQLWRCLDNNSHQIWTLSRGGQRKHQAP